MTFLLCHHCIDISTDCFRLQTLPLTHKVKSYWFSGYNSWNTEEYWLHTSAHSYYRFQINEWSDHFFSSSLTPHTKEALQLWEEMLPPTCGSLNAVISLLSSWWFGSLEWQTLPELDVNSQRNQHKSWINKNECAHQLQFQPVFHTLPRTMFDLLGQHLNPISALIRA